MTLCCPSPRANLRLQSSKAASSSQRESAATSRLTSAPDRACLDSSRGSTLSCGYCDKDGFPNKKALKYHNFRVHKVPMGKTQPSVDRQNAKKPAASLLPSPSPALQTSVSHSDPSHQVRVTTSPVSALPPAISRHDAQISLTFPIHGNIACPESGCTATFVSRVWNSMKGSLIKHLRFVHRVSIATCVFKCDICHLDILGKPREHPCFAADGNPLVIEVTQALQCSSCSATFSSTLGLQNHEKAHMKSEALSKLPAFALPPSRRRKRARKARPTASPVSDEDTVHVSDASQILAPPADADSGIDSQQPVNDFEDEPLHHFQQIFADLLECEATAEGVHLLSETFAQIVTEARRETGGKPSGRSGGVPERAMLDSTPVIEEYFSEVWSESSSDSQFFLAEHPERDEVLGTLLSVSEVNSAFKSCENTAPGPDRITYNHWRSLDPRATLMTHVFNCCIHLRAIPLSWKESTTILLPKSGDVTCPTNWRPIALGNTAYKLFMKCLAARLQAWCTKHDVLSPSQKGFTPFDGVMEHNFVLQRRIEKARATKSSICLAFLDISNAFGSLPHSAIRDCLAAIGVGDTFLDLIVAAYSNCTTNILSNDASTAAISIKCGVKQGCPLSGILFNLCIDPVIRAVQGDASQHRVLAYADDLVLLADTPQQLQDNIDLVFRSLSQLSLFLNPSKCKSIHICGSPPAGVRSSTFYINEVPISRLQEFDFTKFLGKPVGFNACPNYASINDLSRLGMSIMCSALAPWQRIDALKAFFFPSTQFAMRTAQFKKTDWEKIDRMLRKEIKHTLSIPDSAANEYLYGHRKHGCMAIPIAAEESDLNTIDSAFKLLTSRDERLREIVVEHLSQTVRPRVKRPPTDQDLSDYLSASTSNGFLKIISQDSFYQDLVLKPQQRRRVLFSIRDRLRVERSLKLMNKLNQGKVLKLASLSPASSHFVSNGSYTRFADWRFIHKARLNLVPLNGCQQWKVGFCLKPTHSLLRRHLPSPSRKC
ncbi:retrovirus-related Pol polyprotein from type-1 retrotransposable element R2 [Caerostris extrusa]|uniref:Retrovirus-related Pol polyprotein from type-1 retrotransposable element R2 n=1 Tax=Caerostris extrusa TaxID=172846 RepID=A0AAV4Y0E2_CAEEX|nr:retrovirus-related Pol polyprotein from type-1 retrotransposable element R2 [Caerostris extrusa]